MLTYDCEFSWLLDPRSLLYDPAVAQAVFNLMRKLCLLLVCELNHLGARVLHCSFDRLVLSTQRRSLDEALAFVDTLEATMSQKALFRSVNMIPRTFNRCLVWLDRFNWARLECARWDPVKEELQRLEEVG